ncbi:MAG: OsmC family protein [Anaerolineales bacterium]|nr:OsmC family protein [Anaerolineales bacterium]
MDTRVTWQEGLTFTGTAGSGFSVPLGASAEVGGADDGFRPLELMGVSLAGCTAMDVISILKKKRQDVTAFEVRVHAERAQEHPRIFTHIKIEYIVTGRRIDPAAVERALELSKTTYCPAQAMLARVVEIELSYQIIEV